MYKNCKIKKTQNIFLSAWNYHPSFLISVPPNILVAVPLPSCLNVSEETTPCLQG